MGFLPPNAARILSATGSASANCPFRWQGPLHGCTTCPLPEGSSLSSSALLSRDVASADWPPRGDGRGPGDRRWGCTHAIRSCPSHQHQDGQGLLNGDNHQEGRRRVHLHLGFLGYVLTVLRPNSIVWKLVGVLPLGYFMLSPAKLVQSRTKPRVHTSPASTVLLHAS